MLKWKDGRMQWSLASQTTVNTFRTSAPRLTWRGKWGKIISNSMHTRVSSNRQVKRRFSPFPSLICQKFRISPNSDNKCSSSFSQSQARWITSHIWTLHQRCLSTTKHRSQHMRTIKTYSLLIHRIIWIWIDWSKSSQTVLRISSKAEAV